MTSDESAYEIFTSRPLWRDLPSAFLDALAHRLGSAENAGAFALLCERTRLLQDNIRSNKSFAERDPSLAVDGLAAVLTSYANRAGKEDRLDEAKEALELALIFRPRHAPAWYSLALAAFHKGDYTAAAYWADQFLDFTPDPESENLWEQGFAEAMTENGEKDAARGLGLPEIVGNWERCREQMEAVKDACR